MAVFVCDAHLQVLAAFVSNDDVTIDISTSNVELHGATNVLASFGKDARPYFLDMLESPDKFGAAHVALTELTESPSWFSGKLDMNNSDNYDYNRMSCRANGNEFEIDEFTSQPPLKEWWDDYLLLARKREGSTLTGGIMTFGDFPFDQFDTEH